MRLRREVMTGGWGRSGGGGCAIGMALEAGNGSEPGVELDREDERDGG